MSRIQRLRSAETGPRSAGTPVRIKTPFAARAGSAPKATSGTPTASKTTSISRDPFIVYTSNVFAILGFGWLYFALAEIVQMFHLIHYGLSAVLVFLGAKIILTDLYKVPTSVSFAVIVVVLGFSIVASLIWPRVSPTSPRQRPTGTNRRVS